MTNTFEVLKKQIEKIQEQQEYHKVSIELHCNLIHDLGFASLDIAQLVAMMEGELGIDPFSEGATLDQISTIEDMTALYKR